jgi:cellulose synthase/poly-beta-1,6-N-acetylglucosamine synthase-like glycosyltransferase
MFKTSMVDPSKDQITGADHSTAVSVLMPCFNAAETLDESMQSLASQTLREIEIIPVDDGSLDKTPEILAHWASADARVRPIYKEHAGIIEALNAGLAACQAPYIARMDADDWAHEERLERQSAYLDGHPELAVVGCLVKSDHAGEGFQRYLDWLNSLISAEDIAREIFIESPVAHPSTMMRRSWIEQAGGYQDRGWAEDYDLWLRIHQRGGKIAKVSEVLLSWRDYPERLTRSDSRYSVENFLRAKAHYLCAGPLQSADGVLVWGAGQMGRRISKHLVRGGAQLSAFVDVDPGKIGRTLRSLPIISRDQIRAWWRQYEQPVLLSAVGSRGARKLIRAHLVELGLVEGEDWWAVA